MWRQVSRCESGRVESATEEDAITLYSETLSGMLAQSASPTLLPESSLQGRNKVLP